MANPLTTNRHWISRLLLVPIAFLSSFLPPSIAQAADRNLLSPPPSQLQAGDLIWPKKPEAIVPYNSRPGLAGAEDAVLWRQEKEAFLDKLRNGPEPTPAERARYKALQPMSYEEFVAKYLDDRISGEPASFGTGSFYIGHVGILNVVHGTLVVVEAVMGKGVRSIPYEEWLKERSGELIWVGRLKNLSSEKRAQVAKMASEQVGKPYDFWNFNLSDTKGFYCSKLAWFSILLGAGFSPDDNPDPDRTLWYSPKQLMLSRHIELIANPGNYGKRD